MTENDERYPYTLGELLGWGGTFAITGLLGSISKHFRKKYREL